MNSSDKVYNMLGFQYKKLETALFEGLKKEGRPELIAQYKKWPSMKKIAFLDKMAGQMGL